MNENDFLKELFRSLPEIEPSKNLKNRILFSLEKKGAQGSPRIYSGVSEANRKFWMLKPAMAFASYIFIALLGTLFSIHYLQTKGIQNETSTAWTAKSPIMRWAQTQSDIEFLKGSGSGTLLPLKG